LDGLQKNYRLIDSAEKPPPFMLREADASSGSAERKIVNIINVIPVRPELSQRAD
jgi:hypothetical protein